MAQPTSSDVHVNVPLTNISVAFIQGADGFIADKVFPVVPVLKQSDRYYVYKRDAFFRSDAEKRAPATETPGTGYIIDNTPTYFADVYGVHDDVDDQVRANSDSVLQPDIDSTELVTQQLLIKRETAWTGSYFGTGLWTGIDGSAGDVTGVDSGATGNQVIRWNNTNSTPIEDVKKYVRLQQQLTGFKPNTLVLGPQVLDGLLENAEIVDRVKYSQLGFLDTALLAKAFGVERVLVPEAVQNTASEGAALSMSFIYGKNALLCYAAPSPGLRKPSAGYTFAWNGYLGNSLSVQIRQFRMEHLKADRIEGEMAFAQKQVVSDMGTFFNGCVD